MRGEFELIELLRERIVAAGAPDGEHVRIASGDDAAVTEPPGATATSVDAVVEGVHFRRATFPPRAIGAKALAAAISDIAAMGALPGEAYVQLGLPAGYPEAELSELADGLGELAAAEGFAVAGGDVVAAPALFVAVTVVGHAESARALVTRAGAQPGDALVVTGELGGAAAGLLLCEGEVSAGALPAAEAASLRERQLAPRPRMAAGAALARAGASAMIDVSDGLAGDAAHIAEASGVAVEIDTGSLPVQGGVAAVASAAGIRPEELFLGGGEDYELLASVPAEELDAALAMLRATGVRASVVGRILAGSGVRWRSATGGEAGVPPTGFDQVRSRARGAPD